MFENMTKNVSFWYFWIWIFAPKIKWHILHQFFIWILAPKINWHILKFFKLFEFSRQKSNDMFCINFHLNFRAKNQITYFDGFFHNLNFCAIYCVKLRQFSLVLILCDDFYKIHKFHNELIIILSAKLSRLSKYFANLQFLS